MELFWNIVLSSEVIASVITGVFTFGAGYYASSISRNQHNRQEIHKALVIRTNLLAEMCIICDRMNLRLESLSKDQSIVDPEGFIFINHSDYELNILQNSLNDIGLLSSEEATSVFKTYSLIGRVFRSMLLCAVTNEEDDPHANGWYMVENRRRELLARAHKKIVESINESIALLRCALERR